MTRRQSNIILVGIVLAIALAFVCVGVFGERMVKVEWVGEFFLTSLRMIVVPLIVCSMIVGISGLGDVRRLGRVGTWTLVYYATTTGMSVLLGIILVNIVRPGAGMEKQANEVNAVKTLHDIAGAQEDFRSRILIDRTGDLIGEYGFLGDLIAPDGGPPLLHIEGSAAGSAPSEMSLRGYRYRTYLPSRDGPPVTSDRRAAAEQTVDSSLAQNAWAAVAWPENPGVSGEHAFYMNQRGVPFLLPEDRWLPDGGPLAGEELFRDGPPLPSGIELPEAKRARIGQQREMGFSDIILSFVSRNIVRALADMDVLPIIIFSLLFGALLTTIGDKGRPVIDFFTGANEAVMKIVYLIMWTAPVGIFGLVAAKFGGTPDLAAELSRLGRYITTVILGLLIHGGIVLPALLLVLSGRNPLRYAFGMGKALLTAFSTASSSATLPVTIESATVENRVSRRSALFVLPIGATVNMDGTALYESVAAIFIAQAYGIELGLWQQAMIFVTATLAAVGAAGIPEAGLFTMVLVLKAVGLPLEGIALLLVIDWFLDRCRTTINVWGDSVGAAIIERLDSGGSVPQPQRM